MARRKKTADAPRSLEDLKEEFRAASERHGLVEKWRDVVKLCEKLLQYKYDADDYAREAKSKRAEISRARGWGKSTASRGPKGLQNLDYGQLRRLRANLERHLEYIGG